MLPQSPFTRQQALADGMSPHLWRTLTRERRIREIVQGVYVDASLTDTVDLRIAAIAKVLQPGQVLARASAAWSYGVDVFDARGLPATPRIDVVTRDQSARAKGRLVHAHSADDLRDDDITERGGIAMTTPLRTAADLGRFARRSDALVSLDWFLHQGLVTKDELVATLPRWVRRRGVTQLRELVAIASPLCESPGETHVRLMAIDIGLPNPELQIWVENHAGRAIFRLDMGYRELLLAFEYDGVEHHGPDQEARDRARREWLASRGWLVLVFRSADVFVNRQASMERMAAAFASR